MIRSIQLLKIKKITINFSGSGTTGHAVLLMNKNDGENRRFILNTNNDNDIAKSLLSKD